MRRIALFAAVITLLATAAAGSSAAVFPQTIALPNGWLPEGIAIAPGGTFYAGSRADGAVYGGSVKTGLGGTVVPGQAGRVAVGVDYDRGRLFVAGGYSGSGNLNGFNAGRIVAELVATGRSDDADLYDTSRPVVETDRPNYPKYV